jgi:translation initiation factor IF-3
MPFPYSSGGPRPMGPRRPYPSQHPGKALRKNERIRSLEVRVIGPDGKQIGVLATREAIRIAQTHALDLVEVSPGARPPVCRILDYGKYMYDLGKKQKDHKTHASKLKEVKFRPRIEHHDYITKLRHAEEFLFHGNKVKMTLFFKGRELEHKDLGFETMKRAVGDLAHVGLPDQPARLFGRNITLTLSPLPPNKRKWKYNLREDEEPPAAGHGAPPKSPPPAAHEGASTSLGAALDSAHASAAQSPASAGPPAAN